MDNGRPRRIFTEVWRHVRRGGQYLVVAQSELQSSGGPVSEGAEITAYVGIDDGKQWARPRAEFEDGRFERLWNVDEPELRSLAGLLMNQAAAAGYVVTIEQRPLLPLAMGNYETVTTFRRVRNA